MCWLVRLVEVCVLNVFDLLDVGVLKWLELVLLFTGKLKLVVLKCY
jgi:hypothetical protein